MYSSTVCPGFIDLHGPPGILQRLANRTLKWRMNTGFCIPGIGRSIGLVLLSFLLGHQPGYAGPLDFSSEDTVTITAQRAWEGEEVDVIHFSGDFELHAPDWSMAGDTAVVYGNLDDPDRVIVEGAPARVSFLRETEDGPAEADSEEKVDGEASVVEYLRATDRLIMTGAAHLVRKDSTLASELIEYDVDTDRYSAGGEGGIKIEYSTDDD
jgi:lipopolysaccharide transport protein LptA